MACSGSGGSNAAARAACEGRAFCIAFCNLGCATNGGCSVGDIAVNQPLVFKFSREIEPSTVNQASFSIRTANGESAKGDLFVQGDTVRFLPSVTTVNGQNVYGFVADKEYTLEIAGGAEASKAITSLSGDRLEKPLRCKLVTSRGVIDLDGKPPVPNLVLPTKFTDVAEDSLIVLDFSEVINTSTFTSTGTGGGIFYTVALPDDTNPGNCVKREFPLPGAVNLSIDRVKNTTRVIFRPSLLLPSESCVRVSVTDQIRDLAGKGAKPKVYEFRVRKRPVAPQKIAEDFSSTAKRDTTWGGADWKGTGVLRPGKLGGSGKLGEFRAADGKDLLKKDSKGRDMYEWSLDDMTIPKVRTLTGQDERVTNGVFEFARFVVNANEHVVFTGSNPPRIIVSGEIRIDGKIDLPTPIPANSIERTKGHPGGKGGPGGATGGQGADSSGTIVGRNGGTVVLPAGHPRASQAAGTGGFGSPALPTSGDKKDIVWIIESGFKVMTRMTTSGGGGGSLWDTGSKALLGKPGKAEKAVAKPPFWPYQNGEFGADSKPGAAFPVLPGLSTKKSSEMFLIGGSGGGGSGAHVLYTADENNIQWSNGAGGGGGGGVIHFQSGGDFRVTDDGEISVLGGNSLNQKDNNKAPPARSPGGAGSGGSVLVQCGGNPQVTGVIDVSGGKGGIFKEDSPFLLYTKSNGGDGGAGYIRIEADPAPKHTNFARTKPVASAGNVGLLRSIDYAKQSLAASGWYAARSLFPPTWQYFIIKARINGKLVTFSDDAAKGQLITASSPIQLWLQSASVDAVSGKRLSDPTDWIKNGVKALNDSRYEGRSGNGVRFLMLLDMTSIQTLQIEDIEVVYVG